MLVESTKTVKSLYSTPQISLLSTDSVLPTFLVIVPRGHLLQYYLKIEERRKCLLEVHHQEGNKLY